MNYVTDETAELDAERVDTICLDDFCRDHRIERIDLLKLDVQGNEHSVLQGAERLIRLGLLGTVVMELNWADDIEICCPATQSVRLLAECGYRFASPARCDNWREAGNWIRGLNDIIARRYEGT
jgi:hypothetical protein